MPEHMRMTRDELVNFLEESVKKGYAERIHAVLAARSQASRLPQAESPIPDFTIVTSGFEQAVDKSNEALVKTSGEIRALFGDDERGSAWKASIWNSAHSPSA